MPFVRGPDDIEEKFDEVQDQDTKYTDADANYDFSDSPNNLYEDFVLPTNSRITALNLYDGDTLTYSQYPDFYEFRVLKKRNATWQFDQFGPFIDKTVDEVYICTGIHYLSYNPQYIDVDSDKNLSEDVLPPFGQYVIIVSIRGKDAKSLNLTAKGHMKMNRKEKATML